jgi:predicted ribosome quality control (RQC) complex YloA/Tae2 family protein
LTQNDIIKAINEGKLQFREGSIYGNPYSRLLRSEVEKLAEERFGKDLFKKKKTKNELKKINKEIKELKAKISELEKKKAELNLLLMPDDSLHPAV